MENKNDYYYSIINKKKKKWKTMREKREIGEEKKTREKIANK